MNLIELLFGKQCDHDDHVTDTIKGDYSKNNDGIFADETDVITCSKCGRYYFLHRGMQKQESFP